MLPNLASPCPCLRYRRQSGTNLLKMLSLLRREHDFFIPFWLLPRSDVGNHALHKASAQTRMSALRLLALDAGVQQPCQSCDDKDYSDP